MLYCVLMKESLVVVRGPIGVGKSSLSRALQQELPQSSFVETDVLKHMAGPDGSSPWRRGIAHETAAFMVGQLLRVPRTAIVEVHTKYPNEVDRYEAMATQLGTSLVNVLLTAPLEVCQARTVGRPMPGVTYEPDYSLIDAYYCNLEPRPGDLVYDTVALRPEAIVSDVMAKLSV
jgi:predicted kinase